MPAFVHDWKRIGMSCDFKLAYSTINEHCRRISQWSFLDLQKKGRVYRKNAPALWCPLCETAISQVECQDAEKNSTFNDIAFKAEGKELVIATTRPELIPACVAVFAHPNDDRYKKLIGKKATTPLFNKEVPILADERVDPAKGTGIVMCCTFGDQTDIQWYLAYKLPLIDAIGKNGMMTEKAGKYQGMKIHEARKAILADMKTAGLLRAQKPIQHAVKVHERCQTEIEIIQSKQWFVQYLDLKEKLLEWGAQLNWHPDFMIHRYNNWVKGLQWDWLISRQRFFGVPFPVWYCKKCDEPIFADDKKLPIDPLKDKPTGKCKCGSTEFIGEKDVLDTWATSSMTPQLAVQMVPEKHRSKLYPMSLRPQAHEIISFWLFNTLVKSQLHYGKNPWKDIALSGYVTDPLGEKMSKSKGNVIEPQAILAKYSADALRYWAGSSKLGEDIAYQEKELVSGDKFVTKLWNAAKFTNMHLEGYDYKGTSTETLDLWIHTRLAKTIKEATEAFDNYEYFRAKQAIEAFFWKDFCDNYLELIKSRMYEPKTPQQKKSAQHALYTSLSALVRLMAPFTPFITEEVYTLYLKQKEGHKSVHLSNWPETPAMNEKAEQAGNIAVAVLAAVRKKKSEMKLSMKAPVKKLVIDTKIDISGVIEDLKATTAAEKLELGKATEELTPEVKITAEF
jgi:valyl-tRNA synthetase